MVELFCFLKNGGDIDRVTVLPVVEASNEADEAAADATTALQRELGRFRVERARCSQERDTQKLLGCIVRARHSASLSLAHARVLLQRPSPSGVAGGWVRQVRVVQPGGAPHLLRPVELQLRAGPSNAVRA